MARTWIVVPCYEEADRLDVAALDRYLERAHDVAMILVDDGSRDRTLAILRQVEARWPGRVVALDLGVNRGKAEAVRVGMQRALGEGAAYAGYWDADWATPLDAIDAFVQTLDGHPEIDLVLGSRVALLGRHIQRRPIRHYLGRAFATAASLVLSLPVYDTQCGAKLIRVGPPTRGLFETPFRSRWIFDVELLARYLQQPGADAGGIYELPLDRWTDVGDSKVRKSDFLRAFFELAMIFRTYRASPREPR